MPDTNKSEREREREREREPRGPDRDHRQQPTRNHGPQSDADAGAEGVGGDQPAEEMGVGDLMDVSPQDRGVSLARALLEETDGPPAERAEQALQAAQARQQQAQKNLERARRAAQIHEVAVKTLQELQQQRTYINQAAQDLGQRLAADGNTAAAGGVRATDLAPDPDRDRDRGRDPDSDPDPEPEDEDESDSEDELEGAGGEE